MVEIEEMGRFDKVFVLFCFVLFSIQYTSPLYPFAALQVYDITSRKSLQEVQDLRVEVERARDGRSIPMMLVGNKCDLEVRAFGWMREWIVLIDNECEREIGRVHHTCV